MTMMTTSSPSSPSSPLTVKEQFERSASKIWSSVKKFNEDHNNIAFGGDGDDASAAAADIVSDSEVSSTSGSHVADDYDYDDDEDTAAYFDDYDDDDIRDHHRRRRRRNHHHEIRHNDQNQNPQVLFQTVIHAVFSSCTTGAPYPPPTTTRQSKISSSSTVRSSSHRSSISRNRSKRSSSGHGGRSKDDNKDARSCSTNLRRQSGGTPSATGEDDVALSSPSSSAAADDNIVKLQQQQQQQRQEHASNNKHDANATSDENNTKVTPTKKKLDPPAATTSTSTNTRPNGVGIGAGVEPIVTSTRRTISKATKTLLATTSDVVAAQVAVDHLREKQQALQQQQRKSSSLTLLERTKQRKQQQYRHQKRHSLRRESSVATSAALASWANASALTKEATTTVTTTTPNFNSDNDMFVAFDGTTYDDPPLTSIMHSPNRPSSSLSFFPASNPLVVGSKGNATSGGRASQGLRSFMNWKKNATSQQLQQHQNTTTQSGAVPTEVPSSLSSSPRKANGKAYPTISYGSSFDFDDDGVSIITQETVDVMVQTLERDNPNGSYLHRVYSDSTDPINENGTWKGTLNTSMMSSEAHSSIFPASGRDRNTAGAADHDVDHEHNVMPVLSTTAAVAKAAGLLPTQPQSSSHRGGAVNATTMSPPRLNRETRSSDTKSFFTKTSNSTQTEDIHSLWKKEEQEYWNSLVATEGDRGTKAVAVASSAAAAGSAARLRRRDPTDEFHHNVFDEFRVEPPTSSTNCAPENATGSPRFNRLQRLRNKIKQGSAVNTESGLKNANPKLLHNKVDDQMMDFFIMNNLSDVAEI